MVQGLHISLKYFITFMIPLWLVVRFIILLIKKIMRKQIQVEREFTINFFAVYIILLVGITLFPITMYWVKQKYYVSPYIEFIPFKFLFESIHNGVPINSITRNLLGNIFLTTPLGIFLPILWRNKFGKIRSIILFGLIISFSIEVLQYIEGIIFPSIYIRTSDINDIIFNTLGTILGYFVYFNLFRHKLGKNVLKYSN